jgi:nucleoid-associated protein YgaU
MSLNFRPQSFSSPATGADLAGAGGHEFLKGSLSAGAESGLGGGLGQVDLSQMQVSFQPPMDATTAAALPSGIEFTGTLPAPTGMEAQALAAMAPPPMDATPMVAALAGANEPISPIIQLIMRMPGAMGLMNSFFEALGQFFLGSSPLAGLFDHTLFAHLGSIGSQVKLGMPGMPGLEHSAINMSLLPQNAPIFQTMGGMGAHSFMGGMPFDSLASKFATAPQLNFSPEHFAVNKLNVSGGLDLNKPQFEWSSKLSGQDGAGYSEMLSGPQLSDGKLASHLGGTQRLFSDKLQASSGLASAKSNFMPMNSQPALANSGLNQSLSQSVPLSNNMPSSLNVGSQSFGGSSANGLSASGSMRDVSMPSADNNVSYRMGQGSGADASSLDAAQASMDSSSNNNLLAYNNNPETFRPTLGSVDKGLQAAGDSGSQWNQPQSVAKPPLKMEGLKAKQLTFDSLKDTAKSAHPAANAAHSAKPVMDHQGHQLKAGGSHGGHGTDGISHRSLPGVEYHKPAVSHQIAKPSAKPMTEFKPRQIAENQIAPKDASSMQNSAEAINQPQDATGLTGDQAIGAPSTPTQYTIRAGDCLWNIAKNQLGDALKWQDIFNANKDILGSNPDLIHPGTTINLPGQDVAAHNASNYVVKSGDSLWKISQDLLGDGSRWNELYQANASIIGDNPRLIMPGQELTIPGMDGADTLAQGAAASGTQTAQAAGQQTLQSATQVPTADAQQAFTGGNGMEAQAAPQQVQNVQHIQEMPQIQEQPMAQPQSGAGAAQGMPQASQPQVQPASYQPQAPANYQQLPAASLPADKNTVVSSTMVPTDIVEMFKKAR